MPDFITLTCPQCGGKLQITNDIDRFACQYCGAEHIVRRGGGIVSLAPVMEKLQGIEQGISQVITEVGRVEKSSSKAAAELAINRIRGEIIEAEAELERLKGLPVNPTAPKNDTLASRLNGLGCWVSVAACIIGLSVVTQFRNSEIASAFFLITVGFALLMAYLMNRGLSSELRQVKRQKQEAIDNQKRVINELQSDLQRNQKIAKQR